MDIAAERAYSFDGARRARSLAKQEFLHLAGRRLRQLAENDLLRRLEARKVLPAMLDQVRIGHGGARLDLDEGARRLAPLRVGLRDDGGREHRGMTVQNILHFKRADVLA